MIPPKIYLGNYPNSANYNDNIPIGYNKWDAMEYEDERDEEPEEENTEDEYFENENE